MNSGNKTVFIAVLSALDALAAADAGHEDEDGYKSNWLVADVDCRADAAVDERSLTRPEQFATLVSVQVTPAWMPYPDCESR